jgi:hypothetical protein
MAKTVPFCRQLQKAYFPVNMAAVEQNSWRRKVKTARPLRVKHLKEWRG